MTTDTCVIDVRSVEISGGYGLMLDAFDGLATGASFVAVTGQNPSELLRRLQSERGGLFEWSPLETGPSSFRTEVTRRAGKPGARREITEALAWDHDRLDALDRRAFELFAAGDAQGARATWSEFMVGLKRHIRFEEEILFPTFEDKLGMPPTCGPTAVMRSEHREIERIIEAIGLALSGDGAPLPLREELHSLLGQHNSKEEQVLYPGTDRCLTPAERDALVARIQAS